MGLMPPSSAMLTFSLALSRGCEPLSVKDQMEIFQACWALCHYISEVAIDIMEVNGHGCVPLKLSDHSWIWPKSHHSLVPGLETKTKTKSNPCSVCQFLWCKNSHNARFQAMTVPSSKMELGRGVQEQSLMQNFLHTETIDISKQEYRSQ